MLIRISKLVKGRGRHEITIELIKHSNRLANIVIPIKARTLRGGDGKNVARSARKSKSKGGCQEAPGKETLAHARRANDENDKCLKVARARVKILISKDTAAITKKIAEELLRNGGDRSAFIKARTKVGQISTFTLLLRRTPFVGSGDERRVVDLLAIGNGLGLSAAAGLKVSPFQAWEGLELRKGHLLRELQIPLEVVSAGGTDLFGKDHVRESVKLKETVGLGIREAEGIVKRESDVAVAGHRGELKTKKEESNKLLRSDG